MVVEGTTAASARSTFGWGERCFQRAGRLEEASSRLGVSSGPGRQGGGVKGGRGRLLSAGRRCPKAALALTPHYYPTGSRVLSS